MINKDSLREKVKKAIEVMPYTAIVKREGEDIYHQPIEPTVICTLIGLRYLENSKINITVAEKGESRDKESLKFLVDWNEASILVKEKDILEIEGERYQVNALGNTNEVCFDMQIEKI